MNAKRWLLSLALLAVVAATAVAVAGEDSVSLKGTLLCAKCSLKVEGQTTCQSVVQAKNDKGETVNYYVVKNDVAEKFGHVCQGSKEVAVTGMVSQKDGKTWIEPTKMEEVAKS